jgi:hypothetical protein
MSSASRTRNCPDLMLTLGLTALLAAPAFAQAPKVGDPPDAKNMRLVGFNDLQARSAYQPIIQKQGDRYIAYIGHHGGTESVPKPFNPLTRQAEFNGTSILDVTDPARPRRLVDYPTPTAARGVAVSGSVACILLSDGFEVVDVSDPVLPRNLGRYRTDAAASVTGLAVAGSRAFLSVEGTSRVLEVVDFSNPQVPRRLLRYDVQSWPDLFPTSTQFSYLPDEVEGWMIQDVSEPANPVTVGGYRTIASARKSVQPCVPRLRMTLIPLAWRSRPSILAI